MGNKISDNLIQVYWYYIHHGDYAHSIVRLFC